jgi:hypothetical protein
VNLPLITEIPLSTEFPHVYGVRKFRQDPSFRDQRSRTREIPGMGGGVVLAAAIPGIALVGLIFASGSMRGD